MANGWRHKGQAEEGPGGEISPWWQAAHVPCLQENNLQLEASLTSSQQIGQLLV